MIKKTIVSLSCLFILSACYSTSDKVVVEQTKKDIDSFISNKKMIINKINKHEILYNKDLIINFITKEEINFAYANLGCTKIVTNYIISDDFIKFENVNFLKKGCSITESQMNYNDLENQKILNEVFTKKLKVSKSENNIIFSDEVNEISFSEK